MGQLIDEDRSTALVADVRTLMGTVRVLDAPGAVLDEAADLIRRANDLLAPHATLADVANGAVGMFRPGPHRDGSSGPTHVDEFPYSPVTGALNPISPPLDFTFDGDRLRARATFDLRYSGPPGGMHGGIVALLFDELLGTANHCHGVGARTGTLSVRYERMTPLGVELELEGWLDRVEGRKVFARGTISQQGVVTASSEGIFILSR